MVWSGERWGGEGEVSIVTIKDSFVELELPRREGRDRNSKLNKQPHWKPVQRIVRHSFWLYGRGFLEAKLAG